MILFRPKWPFQPNCFFRPKWYWQWEGSRFRPKAVSFGRNSERGTFGRSLVWFTLFCGTPLPFFLSLEALDELRGILNPASSPERNRQPYKQTLVEFLREGSCDRSCNPPEWHGTRGVVEFICTVFTHFLPEYGKHRLVYFAETQTIHNWVSSNDRADNSFQNSL